MKYDPMKQNELQDFNDLPNGWVTTTLGKVLPISYGKGLTKDKRDKTGSYPVFGSSGQVGKHSKSLTRKPTLIIGRKGSVGEVYYSPVPCWPIDTTYYVEEQEELHLKFFFYLLKGLKIGQLDKSTAVPGLSRDDYNVVQVAVAPLDQQKLIVAEIEKQFSRLDEAVANLKRVKANLKCYKAAVLKAAVEGKLTEEWRKQHPDVEPASELLKRILAERKKKWEAKHPEKKYKEPAPPDSSNLPELPKGWVWATFEQLVKNEPNAIKAGPFGSSLKKSFYVPKGFKIYGQEQVLRNDPYFGDYYIDKLLYEKLKSCAVQPGDILISLVGTIGRVLILPKDIEPGIINPRLVKLSLDNHMVNAKFIKAYIQSPHVKHFFSLASHGGTMDILNLTILKKIPVPLPPLDEQNIIIQELERIFSVEQELELIIDANEKRAERLRQSILKNAFSGKLVQSFGKEGKRGMCG